jgi:GT2 family glycosyltransferase
LLIGDNLLNNKNNPLVSIVVVNHNGKHHLKICLNSIYKTKYSPFETILVDNKSTDGSVEYVKKRFKWVKVVKNDSIIYPEANNIGVENSRGEYIIFLNNDTEVDENWLKELINVVRKHPSVAVCTCKVKLFSDRSLLNSAGMESDIYGFVFNRGLICRGNFEIDRGQYDKVEEVFAAYSAAMIVRRDVFNKVGGFNSDFGFHYEEIDFCWRVRLAGYKVLYVPRALVYHKMGGAKTTYTMRHKYFIEKNRLRTMIQNYSLFMLLRTLPVHFLLKSSEFLLHLFYGKFNVAWEILTGIFSLIKKLPRIIKDRQKVQKIRKVSDGEIIKYMKKYSMELDMLLKGYGKYVLR